MATSKTYMSALKQLEELKNTAEALRKKELQGVVKRLREAIQLYQIPASELYPEGIVEPPKKRAYVRKPAPVLKFDLEPPKPTKRQKKEKVAKPESPVVPRKTRRGGKLGPRPAKFGDGQGNLWSGGGSTPVWLRTLVEAGHDKEEFRLK